MDLAQRARRRSTSAAWARSRTGVPPGWTVTEVEADGSQCHGGGADRDALGQAAFEAAVLRGRQAEDGPGLRPGEVAVGARGRELAQDPSLRFDTAPSRLIEPCAASPHRWSMWRAP